MSDGRSEAAWEYDHYCDLARKFKVSTCPDYSIGWSEHYSMLKHVNSGKSLDSFLMTFDWDEDQLPKVEDPISTQSQSTSGTTIDWQEEEIDFPSMAGNLTTTDTTNFTIKLAKRKLARIPRIHIKIPLGKGKYYRTNFYVKPKDFDKVLKHLIKKLGKNNVQVKRHKIELEPIQDVVAMHGLEAKNEVMTRLLLG